MARVEQCSKSGGRSKRGARFSLNRVGTAARPVITNRLQTSLRPYRYNGRGPKKHGCGGWLSDVRRNEEEKNRDCCQGIHWCQKAKRGSDQRTTDTHSATEINPIVEPSRRRSENRNHGN